MKKIAVIGLYGVSALYKVRQLPVPGETARSQELIFEPGGKGYNQAFAALRMNGDVFFCTAVGDDLYGEKAESELKNVFGDQFKCIKIQNEVTAHAAVLCDSSGENEVIVHAGALEKLDERTAEILEKELKQCGLLLLQCEMPLRAVESLLDWSKKHGLYTVFNPAPAAALTDAVLQNCDLLTPNWGEARKISGISSESPEEAAQRLLSRGCRAVIITLGNRGAYVREQGKPGYYQEAFRVFAEDTTGAGDVFNGALCAGLAAGNTLRAAVETAAAASALSVTRRGVVRAVPTLAETEEFLEKRKTGL